MAREPHLDFLIGETRSIEQRLSRVKPLALYQTSVPAAALAPAAQGAIERHLAAGRTDMQRRIAGFLAWLEGAGGEAASPPEAQRRYSTLRMRFNAVLAQLDIFADVLSQRSEHETGVFIAGLDFAAAEALDLPGGYYDPPPLVCYIDRGQGAAIRRARTRLPGGGAGSPVGVIRVPRERMVGVGIASSLIHEVGHQAAALLDLVPDLRRKLAAIEASAGPQAPAWSLWSRWLGEIVADIWAVGRIGIAGPMGLIAVVSLPRVFVFRIGVDDPHPFPWIRVRLAIAFGRALWPHPQWGQLDRLWMQLYPANDLDDARSGVIAGLETTMPALVEAVLGHPIRALHGRCLRDIFDVPGRAPQRLRAEFDRWRTRPGLAIAMPPSLAFAVLGQARFDRRLAADAEGRLTAQLLTAWALRAATRGSPRTHDAPRRAIAIQRSYA